MNRISVSKIIKHRFGLIFVLTILIVAVSTITRLVLLALTVSNTSFSFLEVVELLTIGLFYDLVTASYYWIFFVVILLFIPSRWSTGKGFRYFIGITIFINLTLILFDSLAEFLFWDEFNTRFNFIAVDYLVYTNEVIGNIRQSYPVELLIGGVLAIAGIIFFLIRKTLSSISIEPIPFKNRITIGFPLLIVPVIFFYAIPRGDVSVSKNNFVNELAEDGLYQLFAAYRNNEIDYDKFYKRIEDKEAFTLIRNLLAAPDVEFTDSNPFNLEHIVKSDQPEKRLNVVLISVESFSASFMEAFGNTEKITPHLDSLASQSLFFNNVYATGTRTVRGLEALSLCIPPTPGQSIVRRPENEHLFSLGKVFASKGYDTKFIYGGYGYFDNMNYFFGENDYEVHDRVEIPEEEIDYENIWGVADEDLFDMSLKVISKAATDRPVFAHIMTTSNHRPYTYPDGRINIPSHTSRSGAVKYTDFAIDRFLKKARNEKWFSNTIFVIIADHCASSAGKTELPVEKYHIPLMIYSPGNIEPKKIDQLMSQIDLGPTLAGLLNFSYKSKFLGFDIFKMQLDQSRVFVSTYQKLGFLKHDTLVVLEPQMKSKIFKINLNDYSTTAAAENKKLMNEAIAWYQVSSYAFKHHLYQ